MWVRRRNAEEREAKRQEKQARKEALRGRFEAMKAERSREADERRVSKIDALLQTGESVELVSLQAWTGRGCVGGWPGGRHGRVRLPGRQADGRRRGPEDRR